MKTTPETLRAQFERLQLVFMREHYAEVLQQAAQEQWTPEEILERLLAGKIQRREDRALQRRLKAARFPFVKTLDDFDWSFFNNDATSPVRASRFRALS